MHIERRAEKDSFGSHPRCTIRTSCQEDESKNNNVSHGSWNGKPLFIPKQPGPEVHAYEEMWRSCHAFYKIRICEYDNCRTKLAWRNSSLRPASHGFREMSKCCVSDGRAAEMNGTPGKTVQHDCAVAADTGNEEA